ncbi:GspS/AspS pilotin family protein [Vibrio natriegens]|uniref:type II secretion system pilot lipoprotein GspS-beta n=1 Tax=Vibrio natriegens TaxID=691 RepID=UPI001EFCCA49|nr:type II secretion system pilot lipoprotein GspS-beta [Vibrio natriegens]MCG9702995.1 GspS/AspS pilotin family protein [Vibrio natriegens]
MSVGVIRSFGFVLGGVMMLQGCSSNTASDAELQSAVRAKLAANRAELLMLEAPSNSPLKVLSVNATDSTVNLTLQMPTLTTEQAQALPNAITQAYCADRDTRETMVSGVSYHIAVMDQQPKLVTSFDVDVNQCD